MTLDEFEELTLTVLEVAGDGSRASLSEASRVALVDRLLREYVIRTPSEVAAYREQVRQQQDITDAVKMAAASGKLQTFAQQGEPS